MLPLNDNSYYLKGARILLIDDAEPFQRLLSSMLRKAGVAQVTIASTLKEGMHQMNYIRDVKSAAPKYDLVMMDINLPDGSGIEGCKFISCHAGTFNIPVVAISGNSETVTVHDALRAGASDFLQKPLVADLMKMRLGLLLKLSSIENQCIPYTYEYFFSTGSNA